MIVNQTEQQEREYLQQVIKKLLNTIYKVDGSVKDHVDTLQEYKEYLWSNKDIDPHEIRSMRESILNHFALGENVINKRRRLAKILDTPYFGRIDFKGKKESSKANPFYIGIYAFYDTEKKINLIYDWRSPVAGMFYDYELGDAGYQSPTGEVWGHISLKRQYRIRNGRMDYMIETSLTVHDDILQRALSVATDDKMKNIVATIQREQNRVIRNDEAQTLIIQGVAGSGKTSIALHRIAYLLYAMKGTISSGDILILSPNRVFGDYISNVLPELGEESVPQTGMEDILLTILDNKYRYQTFFEQVGGLLDKPDPAFAKRIRYKASPEFPVQLDRFILHIENNYFKATDVKFNRLVTIPAEFIADQFRRFSRYPVRQRFGPMTEYILEMMKVQYRITATTAERNYLKKAIEKMFTGMNDLQVYKDFWEWIGEPGLLKMGKNRTLEYSDLAPLAYLRLALDGFFSRSGVKHLLIDEMQDYSPIQYRVIQKLYPCRKTILGDAGQSVNPYGSSTADLIRKTLMMGEIMKLTKSYRSTYEITAFAQKIRSDNELEPVARHGDVPQIVAHLHPEGERTCLTELISTFKQAGYQSLGIICKTEQQAQELAGILKTTHKEVYFLSSQNTAFVKGILVTSAHMAKGLEFDEVIIPQVNKDNYHSEIDRSMLYIAITRAMHRLTLTCSGIPSPFIENPEGDF